MDFFSNKLFRVPHKEVGDVSACAIQSDTRDMLRQMCLPLIPERRVKGALSTVSRNTGLPYSKLRRVYYGITDHILAFEWSAISTAYARWLTDQERKLERELNTLRSLREERLQGRLDLGGTENDSRPLAQGLDVAAHKD